MTKTSTEVKSLKSKKSSVKKSALQTSNTDLIIGKKLSKLSLPMTGGKVFDLKQYEGKRIVLYFYPKDMTPGCTIEGHEFTKLVPEFKKNNTIVLGISRDSVSKHEKFIEKEKYKIDLVSDEKETACNFFNVIKEKNMYGKKVMGIERSTFVISPNGVIEHAWRKVKAEGHAQEVLNYIKSN